MQPPIMHPPMDRRTSNAGVDELVPRDQSELVTCTFSDAHVDGTEWSTRIPLSGTGVDICVCIGHRDSVTNENAPVVRSLQRLCNDFATVHAHDRRGGVKQVRGETQCVRLVSCERRVLMPGGYSSGAIVRPAPLSCSQ